MVVKNIIFPTSLEKIEDIKNDNIDIFVELKNGLTYTMVVATPLNLLSLMKKDSKDFLNTKRYIIYPQNLILLH
jgi:hypothetical protein